MHPVTTMTVNGEADSSNLNAFKNYAQIDKSYQSNSSSNHFDFNNTFSLEEVECLLQDLRTNITDRNETCASVHDGLVCWPATLAGTSAVVSCFSELNSVPYDPSKNATRFCYGNSSWAERADYSHCKALTSSSEDVIESYWNAKEAETIYCVGYVISLVALLVALWIFIYFKDLRCLRNTIHTNLMVTYVLIDITWIITAILQQNQTDQTHKVACIMMILLTYLLVTNFFWMFVEGLYLYILVVKTFSIELVKFYAYALIGWGLPAIFVTTWAVVKAYYAHSHYEENPAPDSCEFQIGDHFDYIFQCPIILVLIINIFFLGQIMWVLITKLRAATSVESKQYWKAAKALLVLIPLLGITYVVVLVAPTHGTTKYIFSYLQATLLSTQGLNVAILYCFLNGEVRNSLRYHLERWKTQRGIGRAPRHSLTYRTSLQGECLRLYNNRGFRERGSCMSFSTTTTCIGGNCHSCHQCSGTSQHYHANGTYGPVPLKDDNI